MINRLRINNFQSHKFSELDFSKGVNVIAGKTDSGKSAILRSLNWLINNRPSGDSYIKKNEEECSVELTMSNDEESFSEIIKTKNNNQHTYIMRKCEVGEDDIIETYKAFGTDVPEDIKKAINFNELNIQKQIDPPFLLSKTSGEVARFLNKIVELDNIDASQKNIEKIHRKEKNKKELLEEQLFEKNKEKEELSWIIAAEIEFSTIERNKNKEIGIMNDLRKIGEIIDEYEVVKNKLDSCINFDEESESIIDNIQKDIVKKDKIINDIQNLNFIINEIIYTNKKISTISFDKTAVVDIEEIEKNNNYIIERVDMLEKLESILNRVKVLENSISNAISTQEELQKELKNIMPDICPVCGSEIVDE